MSSEEEAFQELSAYTLTRGDPTFIHQHVVDAWTGQHANADTKPIAVFFALVGLYLHVERGYTGREVQRAHMQLAKRPEPWPIERLPATRGALTVCDVVAAAPGPARDSMIRAWAKEVWGAYTERREQVMGVLLRHGIR
jgi:hypothetical protein